MAPNAITSTETCEVPQQPVKKEYKTDILWKKVILFAYVHAAGLYGLYLMLFAAHWYTGIFAILGYRVAQLGITVGAHRLWAHRAFKAKYPLQILLAYLQAMAFQGSIYEWARDHRVHHKYADTDSDPHNANRGFFFSHIGWLLRKKLPEIKEKGEKIDLSDLENNPIVMFQHKHYYYKIMPLACFVIPTIIPMYFWGETFTNSWYVATIFRYCFSLNMTLLVNSAAHMWGYKPYDKSINPAQNIVVAIATAGEGWHNYHHTFPWDYRAAELGDYKLNTNTAFIDLMAKIGQAYDCRTVSKGVIKSRMERTGMYSTTTEKKVDEEVVHPWGWGDGTVSEENNTAETLYKRK